MLLILEDNPGKIINLFLKFPDNLSGDTIVIVDNVADAKAICRMMPTELIDLWLDEEVKGSERGIDLLEFLLNERKCWLQSVLLTSMSKSALIAMKGLCTSHGIVHSVWTGPFG